jgi:calcineurin-like phosphoesterase family protein
MCAIWFTADWHFGHDREFIYKARGFDSVEEMNEAIISRHNSVVSADDDVYVLGDLTLGDHAAGAECIKRMNGRLHIVLGNHCTSAREAMYRELPNVVEVKEAIRLKVGKYHFFLTHFPCMTGNLEKESLTQTTCNLFGHTHQRTNFYNDIPFMYHVGVDSHECAPVLLDDVIEEMKREVAKCKSFL